ncbi:hypothetical protein [Tsuneonella mangrovi]|uniref:hypothetical protein n=1 Tax=Tsuneonella mangrovi TaxID=1982042 RepID=UPI000BA2689A|nr:hypothetical protein [Tsuneonella mangrovi]
MGNIVTAARALKPDETLEKYSKLNDANKERAYRDQVLFTYMAAIDARYRNFIAGLSSQRKGGNALLSTFALYTSALASVTTGDTATGFATSSTFLQGTQGQLNKELFYEQSLPAIIALMESERAKVRAQILTNLKIDRAKTNVEYGLSEAFVDIGKYEDAASVEKAVARLVQQASQKLTSAEYNEDNAIKGLYEAREKAEQPKDQ